MRAVVNEWLEGTGRLTLLVDYGDPIPAVGEVRVRTTLAGICNTVLEIARGHARFQGVLGHEFVGVVDQAERRGSLKVLVRP